MSNNVTLTDLFKRLDEWKEFPWYQHERRADLFFAIFLPNSIIKEISFYDVQVAINGKGCLANDFHTALNEWQKIEIKAMCAAKQYDEFEIPTHLIDELQCGKQWGA